MNVDIRRVQPEASSTATIVIANRSAAGRCSSH